MEIKFDIIINYIKKERNKRQVGRLLYEEVWIIKRLLNTV